MLRRAALALLAKRRKPIAAECHLLEEQTPAEVHLKPYRHSAGFGDNAECKNFHKEAPNDKWIHRFTTTRRRRSPSSWVLQDTCVNSEGICETLKVQAISLLYERKRAKKDNRQKRAEKCELAADLSSEQARGSHDEQRGAENVSCEITGRLPDFSDSFSDEGISEWLKDGNVPTPNTLPFAFDARPIQFPISVPGQPMRGLVNTTDIMRGIWALRSDPKNPFASRTFNGFVDQCVQMCRHPNITFNHHEGRILPDEIFKQFNSLFQLLTKNSSFTQIVENAWTRVAAALLEESSPWNHLATELCRWYIRPALMELLLYVLDDSTSRCLTCLKPSICISAVCNALIRADLRATNEDNIVALFCVLDKAIQSIHPSCYSQACAATNWNVALDEMLKHIEGHALHSPILRAVTANSAVNAEALAAAATNQSLCEGVSRAAASAALALKSQGVQLAMPPSLRVLVEMMGSSSKNY